MNLFSRLARENRSYEMRREEVIRESRDILRESKKIIFVCHEGTVQLALASLKSLTARLRLSEKHLSKPLANRNAFFLYSEPSWLAALEEYLEAWFFAHFLKTGRVTPCPLLQAPASSLIGALSDFTGEILRHAVHRAASRDERSVERGRVVVASVVKAFLPLYATGAARLKIDAAKKNLRRIEEIIYEIKIRR